MTNGLVGICSFLLTSWLVLSECANVMANDAAESVCPGMSQSFSPYSIVIDGGSTGSRLHIFKFSWVDENGEGTCVCNRQGSSRANVPLSAFAAHNGEILDPAQVAEHLLPHFVYAAGIVPKEYHSSTVVKYAATAGMRLLTLEQQEAVYDALYEGLVHSDDFVFSALQRHDIATLSGNLEGYFGAVAANYLSGVIDANLHIKSDESSPSKNPVLPIGALDMGGSSTQIVYLTEQINSGDETCMNRPQETEHDPETCLSDYEPLRFRGDDFFSTSYLSYGVDQFRMRLWSFLVNDKVNQKTQIEGDEEEVCESEYISNPCGFHGHEVEWNGYTLVGTGNAHECAEYVQRLLPHPQEPLEEHTRKGQIVGGVEHPPVKGKFFAMSLYFFTLDSLRVLSSANRDAHEALNLSWPRPSIQELYDALDGLCSRRWEGDLKEIQHNAHEFTRPEVLPHRCLESTYMVTLLRDGFGFHPDSRDITFTFLVDGNEVEWSLGMSLIMFAEQIQEESNSEGQTKNATGAKTNENQEEDHFVMGRLLDTASLAN